MKTIRQGMVIAIHATLLFALATAAHAQSYPPEVQVGSRAISDYEFDWGRDGTYCSTCNVGAGNNRFAFIDNSGNLWVGHVNVDTGGFVPTNGQGKLVDTNATPANVLGNGPEWMSLTKNSALVYDRWLDGKPHSFYNACVGFANVTSDGSWNAGCMSDSKGYVLPIGTFTQGDTKPMVSYQNFSQTSTNVYWRLAQDGAPQHFVFGPSNQTGVTRRWVVGTHKLFLTAPAPPDASGNVYRQAFLYDADGNTLQQLTFEPTNKTSGFMWQAPDYDNSFLFFVRVGVSEVDVYKFKNNQGGQPSWQIVNTIFASSDNPYIYSAEPFVYQGKSYIFFSVSATQEGHSVTPSQIAISNIDPNAPWYQELTSNVPDVRARRDPEYYITSNGPYLYYNRYILSGGTAQPEGVFRVDTGLGPPPTGPAPTHVARSQP